MTRLLTFSLLLLAVLLLVFRVLLELLVGAAGGDVHTAIADAPQTWTAVALLAAATLTLTFMVRARPRQPHRPSAARSSDDEPPRLNKLPLSVKSLAAIAAVSLLGCSSCATMKEQGRAVAGDVIDCMTEQAKQLDQQFGPVVDALLQHATQSDGNLDWSMVKDRTKQLALDSGRCVLARAVARFVKPYEPAPGTPQAAGLDVDTVAVRAGWRELAGGKTYRTPDGDI